MKSEFNPQLTALKLALKRMFQSSHFSICTIDSCLKLTGAIPNKEVYKIMHTVHCVDFKEMDADFRQWIFEQSILMFQANGFDFNKFEILDSKISTLYLS